MPEPADHVEVLARLPVEPNAVPLVAADEAEPITRTGLAIRGHGAAGMDMQTARLPVEREVVESVDEEGDGCGRTEVVRHDLAVQGDLHDLAWIIVSVWPGGHYRFVGHGRIGTARSQAADEVRHTHGEVVWRVDEDDAQGLLPEAERTDHSVRRRPPASGCSCHGATRRLNGDPRECRTVPTLGPRGAGGSLIACWSVDAAAGRYRIPALENAYRSAYESVSPSRAEGRIIDRAARPRRS